MYKSTSENAYLKSLSESSTYQAGIVQNTTHRLLKKFTDECLAEYGLSTMQWFVVGIIYDAGSRGMTMTELSTVMGTNVPYITNMLNVLEVNKIILRTSDSQKDNRSKTAVIHPAYVPKVAEIEESLRKKMREAIYKNINPDELRTYINVQLELNQMLSGK